MIALPDPLYPKETEIFQIKAMLDNYFYGGNGFFRGD